MVGASRSHHKLRTAYLFTSNLLATTEASHPPKFVYLLPIGELLEKGEVGLSCHGDFTQVPGS